MDAFFMGLGERILRKKISWMDVESELRLIVAAVVRICPEARLIFFGSLANGVATDCSDIDVAVVIPDHLNTRTFRQSFFAQKSKMEIPVDFVFRTRADFEVKKEENPIDDFIATEGIELYPNWNLK